MNTPSTPDFMSVLSSDDSTNVSQTPPSPDQSSPDTPTSGVSSTPDGPPQATAQPQQPSMWKSVLAGALAGLANSAGARSFGAGAGAGAAGELNRQANQVAQQRQAQMDAQAIKFKNADEAYKAAQLANQDQELHLRSQEAQDAHDKNVQEMIDWNTAHGYAAYDAIPNDATAVADHLTSQTAQTGGASVTPGTLLTTHTIFVPRQGPNAVQQRTREFNTFAPAYGLVPVAQGQVSPANYQVLNNLRQGLDAKGDAYTKDALAQQISLTQTRLQRLPENSDPAVISDLKNTLSSLKAQQKSAIDEAGTIKQRDADIETNAINQRADARKSDDLVLVNDASGQAQAMTRAQAEDADLPHMKIKDPETLRVAAAGVSDVQNKLNELASALPALDQNAGQKNLIARAIDAGNTLSFHLGQFSVPTAAINNLLDSENYKDLTPQSRAFINASLGAQEAVTQLPRLQTFGKSNRMTETQMHAAVRLLPGADLNTQGATERMRSLQSMIDPIRKGVPTNIPGSSPWVPSWIEQQSSGKQFNVPRFGGQ
jgi:hypothetical protein